MDSRNISSMKNNQSMTFEEFLAIFRVMLIQPVLITVALVYLFHKLFGLEREDFVIAAFPTFLISFFLSVMLFLQYREYPELVFSHRKMTEN